MTKNGNHYPWNTKERVCQPIRPLHKNPLRTLSSLEKQRRPNHVYALLWKRCQTYVALHSHRHRKRRLLNDRENRKKCLARNKSTLGQSKRTWKTHKKPRKPQRFRGEKMKLEDHITLLRKIYIPYKKQFLTMAHHLFTEHAKEIPDLKTFIDQIMRKEAPKW